MKKLVSRNFCQKRMIVNLASVIPTQNCQKWDICVKSIHGKNSNLLLRKNAEHAVGKQFREINSKMKTSLISTLNVGRFQLATNFTKKST